MATSANIATGRPKSSSARVYLKPGKGTITVNGRDQEVYFARPVLRMMIAQPFQVTDREGQFDVIVSVQGSGLSGQAGAVRHGIARALEVLDVAKARIVGSSHSLLELCSKVVRVAVTGAAGAEPLERLRLEQERVGWEYALRRLEHAG